jgi:hypothetical protein
MDASACTKKETRRLLDAGRRFGWPPRKQPARLLDSAAALDAQDAAEHTSIPDTLPRDW